MKRKSLPKRYECVECKAIISQFITHLERFHLTREQINEYNLDDPLSLQMLLDRFYVESDKPLTFTSGFNYNEKSKEKYIKDIY